MRFINIVIYVYIIFIPEGKLKLALREKTVQHSPLPGVTTEIQFLMHTSVHVQLQPGLQRNRIDLLCTARVAYVNTQLALTTVDREIESIDIFVRC